MSSWVFQEKKKTGFGVWFGWFTHRWHLAGDEVAFLCQHVRHHECGQLWVGVRVDEPIVLQRVAEVACGVVLHQVKKRRLGVVRWSDGGDLVVFVPSSIPTGRATTSSPATTGLTCVALRERHGEKREKTKVSGSNIYWILDENKAKP